MQIVQISELDKKRVRVRLDDGYEFALYKGEKRQYGLQEGEELSSGQLEELRLQVLIKRARRRAMHLLERMDRTENQLRMKLRQGYYPEDVIEDAIGYVKSYHYLDDLRYAQNYVLRCKGQKSRRMIQMELQGKGVSKQWVQQALEEGYQQEDEQEQILRWVRKKNYSSQTADIKEKHRIYQFLMRKGFCPDDILHVLDYLT